MNRIILIGNGFDLAHGLKTGYRQFLNNYYLNAVKELFNPNNNHILDDENICFKYYYPLVGDYEYFLGNIVLKNIKKYNKNNYQGTDECFGIKNQFLLSITQKAVLQNWVDIENEYYNQLLQIIEKDINRKYDDIKKLNSDFDAVKILLVKYLKKELTKTIESITPNEKILKNIYSDFNAKDLSEKGFKKYIDLLIDNLIKNNQINKSRIHQVRKEIRNNLFSNKKTSNLTPENILFLSFNYTNIESLYIKDNTNIDVIHIHGDLNNEENNPIIFGFGDELDDNYKMIEKLNQNEYLENIKSMKYLETDNYKKTLGFLNSDYYQVFIFGHSCGVSDRTLLNTIFEHENCISIKPFYYQKSKVEDNYSNFVRNISRNFNSKVKMREKVVNKRYCEPLS